MASQKTWKTTKPNLRSGKRKNIPAMSLMIIGIVTAVVIGVFFINIYNDQTNRLPALKDAASSRPPVKNTSPAQETFTKLLGRWQRPDGGYIIDISSVKNDGSLEAAYFNHR